MAVGPIYGQMFFSCPVGRRRFGWSEGHYLTTAANLPAALTSLKALAMLRVGLLGMRATLDYLRVSDTDVYRDSQVDDGPPPSMLTDAMVLRYGIVDPGPIYNRRLITDIADSGPQKGKGLASDFPQVGFMVRLEGGTDYRSRRSFIIRGNPDASQNTDDTRPSGTEWGRRFLDFIGSSTAVNSLLSGSFGFRALDRAGVNAEKPITAMTNVPPYILTIAGHNYAIGDQIRIRGARPKIVAGQPIPWTINGLWIVDSIPTPNQTLTLRGYPGPAAFDSFGKASKRVFVVLPYTKMIGRRWSSRRTGNPFDPIRGRSKTKNSLRVSIPAGGL